MAQERNATHVQRWRTVQARRNNWWRTQEGGRKQFEEKSEAVFPAVGPVPVQRLDLNERVKEFEEPECYLE